MRLFIAIKLSKKIQDSVKKLQDQLVDEESKPSSSPHITLKFLGEVDEKMVDYIKRVLQAVEFKPFPLSLAHTGVFPTSQVMRVSWVSIKEKDKVFELQKSIDTMLQTLGFSAQKHFFPHITLTRLKKKKDKATAFLEKLKSLKVDRASMKVQSFHLIESQLSPKGPIYKEIIEIKAQDDD